VIPLTYDTWDGVAIFFFDDTGTAMTLAFPLRDFHASSLITKRVDEDGFLYTT
jgi:hypothetical protein